MFGTSWPADRGEAGRIRRPLGIRHSLFRLGGCRGGPYALGILGRARPVLVGALTDSPFATKCLYGRADNKSLQ